jgi:hypothetical protein
VHQISGGFDAPSARGYSSQLEESGIQQNYWLNFLDGLNIAMVSFYQPMRDIFSSCSDR